MEDLCGKFYYQGKDALALVYPDEFESLLRKCIAMATTCVYVPPFIIHFTDVVHR
jgi:hypothetical protein